MTAPKGWRLAAVGRLRLFPVFSESRQWIDEGSARVSYAGPIPKDSNRPRLCENVVADIITL